MHDTEKLLQTVIAEAKGLGIPVSPCILSTVAINTRAKTRFGRCIAAASGQCTIELSARVLNCSERACKEVLAHEVLHSCKGCRNHQSLWKSYAKQMNEAYGYHIQRTHSCEELGVFEDKPVRYQLQCQNCGAVLSRMKKSTLIAHPERYRCRCGGKLKPIYTSPAFL